MHEAVKINLTKIKLEQELTSLQNHSRTSRNFLFDLNSSDLPEYA